MSDSVLMIESPAAAGSKPDRLAAFFEAFPLRVQPWNEGLGASALYIAADPAGRPREVVLRVRGRKAPQHAAVSATVNFGGSRNPLINSLPDSISVPLDGQSPALAETVRAFMAELCSARCGRNHALDRLGEVIVLMALRAAIEQGASSPCLLAGLAHPQLHPVLVAMHESPGRAWDIEALADIAGMSRSRFMALFPQVVGVTPMTYLTRWRLQFGRRELLKGVKVKSAARSAGFASAEAFSRAYSREFGRSPTQELHAAA